MVSKTIVLLGLFMATVLLISSEVAARELAETSNDVDTSKETNGAVDDGVYPDDHGGYGGGRGGYGGGRGGGRGGYGGGRGGRGKGGGYCRYGCCGKRYKGGCRCCTYAGEKADAEP